MSEIGIPAITFPKMYIVAFEGYLAVSTVAPNDEIGRLNAEYWLEENGKQFGVDPSQLFLPTAIKAREIHSSNTTAVLMQGGRAATQLAEVYERVPQQRVHVSVSRRFMPLNQEHHQQLGIPFQKTPVVDTPPNC